MPNWFSLADKSNQLSQKSTKNWIIVCDCSKMSYSLSESYLGKIYFGIKKMKIRVSSFLEVPGSRLCAQTSNWRKGWCAQTLSRDQQNMCFIKEDKDPSVSILSSITLKSAK